VGGYATSTALAAAITVTGPPEAHSEFSQISVVGELNSQDPVFGYNLYNGIQWEAAPFPPGQPYATGSFDVHDCKFDTVASWAPPFWISNGVVRLINNDAKGVIYGLDIYDIEDSTLILSNNHVQGSAAAYVGEGGLLASSLVVITGNQFQMPQGLLIDGVFSGGTRCFISGNWIEPPTAGITLTSTTSNCVVVGNHGATVVDNGTGNHVGKR
jgi:hypothetical protein